MLILSIFPGIDILGLGFEMEGFCVVRGPDLLWGGDVRNFHPPAGRFDGLIGGPPCQEFSRQMNGREPTGYGLEMLNEYKRIVLAARPEWFLLENVERTPDVKIEGYTHQRLDVWAHEFGLPQRRLRHIQFGSRNGKVLVLDRGGKGGIAPTVTASDSSTPWEQFCELQGLPSGFDLPVFTNGAKRRAVGNAVPLPLARALAAAIKCMKPTGTIRVCACGCGRPVEGKATYARTACRVRVSRKRNEPGRNHAGEETESRG